ncbi:MAG: transporter substrate-binding domain-containing protein [Actinomycetota bacterium]|nr:transporter substrate-binding domain-containing protein [Actinomycetota bacterium]
MSPYRAVAINICRAASSRSTGMRLSFLTLMLGLGLAACGSTQVAELTPTAIAASGLAPGIGSCSFSNLTTLDAAHLAIAHALPKPPYYTPRALRGPVGFDVDVADQIAVGLGFQVNQIAWRQLGRVFDRHGRPNFDIAVAQLEKQRSSQALIYSEPYFTETQVLLALPDTPITKVKSSSELAGSSLGVVLGSSSQAYVPRELGIDPTVYLTNNVLKTAIRDHHITGMVVPVEEVPSFLATSSEPLVVVGQFPPAKKALTYRVALPAGDPLLTCVDEVLAKMTKSGQLDDLRARWFADGVNRTIQTD